jgi:hypothetical protein
MGKSTPIRGGLSAARVAMMIMRVLMEEFLCQGLMGWISVLKCLSIKCAWVPAAMSYSGKPQMVLFSMHPAVTVLDRYYRAPEHDYPRGAYCVGS